MEAIDFVAVIGAAVGTVLAATAAIFTLRIARGSRWAAERAHIEASRDQRTNITIEGNNRVINISDAQLLTGEQFAELRKLIEAEMPPTPKGQEGSTPTVPSTRTDEP
ncbi:hypothetical protein ACGFNX_33710 [Streptomyces sp. NPDC048723]|uniref:hypothetical protein n=1 Tax=Streptomyces sp. NPDC048723 TaxID=3365589 RepID=UPI00372028F9